MMGCFDTVRFRCPACNARQKVTSKSGACKLATYDLSNVPADVIGGVVGEVVVCEQCGARLRFRVIVQVSVHEVEKGEDEEGDDYD